MFWPAVPDGDSRLQVKSETRFLSVFRALIAVEFQSYK